MIGGTLRLNWWNERNFDPMRNVYDEYVGLASQSTQYLDIVAMHHI